MNRQIATFNLGESTLGFDILLVKEVYRGVSITPIPDAPKQIRGLMNLRGRVVTVLDLNNCLNRKLDSSRKENYLLILKTDDDVKAYRKKGYLSGVSLGDDFAGFLIDQMSDVLDITTQDILPPPPNLEEVEGELVEGIVKKDEKLVILLDVTAILERVMKAVETENEQSG